MITIGGRLKNVVDAGCYEVEARPVRKPKLDPSGCGCGEVEIVDQPNETFPRVTVDAERVFVIQVDDASIKRWFEGGPPEFSFRIFLDGQPKPTAQSIRWTPDRHAAPFEIDLCAIDPPPLCGKVCGKVTDCRNHPLAGFRVFIFDVDLSNADPFGTSWLVAAGAQPPHERTPPFGTFLGETITNDCGEYCVSYRYSDYAALEMGSADIRVIVGPPAGEPLQLLQVSGVLYNAPSSSTVDIKVPGSKVDGSSEFTDYDQSLMRLGAISAVARAGLSDQQLDFVSNEASVPIEHLELLRLAYQIDQEYFAPLGVLPDYSLPTVLYGLLRTGVTGPFPWWARRYHGSKWDDAHVGDKLASLIAQAIENCYVSRTLGRQFGPADVAAAGLRIWKVAFHYALHAPLLPSRDSWHELFQLIWSRLQDAAVAFDTFGVAWLRFGVSKAMWDDLAAVLPDADVNLIKDLVEYAEVSGYWEPAVDLFLKDKAALIAAVESNQAWAQYFVVAKVPAPPDTFFATYSAEVLQLARARFGSTGTAGWAGTAGATDFPASLGLSPDQAKAAAQRLARLTTSAGLAQTLASAGFTSARDIAATRWDDYLTSLQTADPNTSRVDALYAYTKAKETHAVSVAATLQLAPVLNAPIDGHPVPYLKAPDLAATSVAAMASTLFGSGSACDCEGRQSVFSPGAYLHALRRFLSGISGIGAGTLGGKAEFDRRRPDVRTLKLGYKNTYTVVPTIDLNTEVMEDLAMEILGLQVPSPPGSPPDRQTTWKAEELALAPEYGDQYPLLYDAFAASSLVLPWRFPFDLNHAKRRIYLDAIGLTRADILRLVDQNASIDDLADLALDLTNAQRALLEDASATSIDEIYGVTNQQPPSSVPTMMATSQLAFQDLYALTQITQIYSPGTPPEIKPPVPPPAPADPSTWVPPAAGCDPAQYTLEFTDTQQGERLHRFVRLWRALPWPMHLLDWAIGAFGQPPSGDGVIPLKWLGAAELIRKRLRLRPHEVVGFWADLSTDRWALPFVQTEAIPSPWEQVFRVTVSDPADLTSNLTLAAAARATGISEAFGTAKLATGASWDSSTAAATASRFFRYGRLSKAIPGVRPEDIKKYEELLGEQVFLSPADTWKAIEDFDVIHRSGARLAAALPLYISPADPFIGVPPAGPGISVVRREILAAIETLNRQTTIPANLPFDAALSRFTSPDTASLAAQQLAQYEDSKASPESIAQLDQTLPELLALPELLTQPLSLTTGANRQALILSALSTQRWDRRVGRLLSQVSGLDAATARTLADQIKTSDGQTISSALRGLIGDGGDWSGWSDSTNAPKTQPGFLDAGSATVPSDESISLLHGTTFLPGTLGDYHLRLRAELAPGSSVQVEGDGVGNGETRMLGTFSVGSDDRSATASVDFGVTLEIQAASPDVPAITLELVEPSGDTHPLSGYSLYSTSVAGRVDAAMEALELLALAGKLATQWKLGARDLAALIGLQNTNQSFPQFPPKGKSRPLTEDDEEGFTAWLAYARLVAAIKMTRGTGRQALYDTAVLAQTAVLAGAGATPGEIWSGLAVALDVTADAVEDAAEWLFQGGLAPIADGNWLRLFELSRAVHKYAVSAATLKKWADAGPTIDVVTSLEAAARAQLVQGRSGSDRLRETADKIRVLKRDVLADFLLSRPPSGYHWAKRQDISDYLLTDIEMEPCAETSRIRLAIAASQRLVSQTLAQAESLQLSAEQEREWQSIARYRLWEVREKILLYPENWLRFGHHLHKSTDFEELEGSLLQGDLTDEKAAESLTRYAERLHEIGHLEIVGSCTQQEYDPTGALSIDRFHVIGRTPAEPRVYYRRERVDQAYWTPWTKIELEIDCDQIVPFVHNRQLHLFWLVDDTMPQKKPGIGKDDRQLSFDDSFKTLRLAWSVLTSKGWRAKMISKGSLSTRFGHYASNQAWPLGYASPYFEVHAWNEAVQDIGAYQLRPTLSPEGDVQIEVFAPLTSNVVSRADPAIADWVYEVSRLLDHAFGWSAGKAADWFAVRADAANAHLNALVGATFASADASLHNAVPTIPVFTPSGSRSTTSVGRYMIGRFRLTPDNLVEITQRSAASTQVPGNLTPADRAQTIAVIGTAVPRSGAYEFDDGSVELHAGGAFRTVLATAGVPVRVVVTRQEAVPSQTDPIFCRIKNRSFFAFKQLQPMPQAVPVLDRVKVALIGTTATYAGYSGNPGYQVAPREYIDRAIVMSGHPNAAVVSTGSIAGVLVGVGFATAVTNHLIIGAVAPWRFALAHHPQTIELLRAIRAGLERLFTRDTQGDSRAATGSLTVPFAFALDYDPIAPWVDTQHLPVDELEFKPDQAYAVANWELLYHAPMTVAQQLMKVGRFEDARRWITHVFNPRDPAARDAVGQHPENYWVFKPFVDFVAGNGVGDFTTLDPSATGGDPYPRTVFRALIKQWRANPYNPHAVAAFRPQAYQLASIFLYVENMIAWGDSLFAIPSAELVEEAARHYEEAERVIGRPPITTGAIRYDDEALSVEQVDGDFPLGSADLENGFSLGDGPSPNIEEAFLPDLATWYFCLPPNPKIGDLRAKIQDRLFKVHHCLDLLGNPRRLPLYDPPINPDLLAEAAMAGQNVSQIVMDAYTPRPHYRFRTLLGIAKGIAQQAVALGTGLLSAMEKRDAESLSLLKATHEAKLLERATEVRKLQVEDAQASVKVLQATMNSVQCRRDFYATREFMNAEETSQVALALAATVFRTIGQALNTAASAAGATPDITAGTAGAWGTPLAVVTTGGENASRVPAGQGRAMEAVADFMGTFSSIAASMGSYRRRKEDWDFQAKSAELELKQIHGQILGAQIRETIAERELENHEAQLEQSRDELDFVRSKQTSVRLYEWLEADLATSYYQAFQLAHSMSLQAQRALHDELGSDQRFIGYAQWDGAHHGVQAGERLLSDLLEMESQYHAQHARPGVKIMNVSLAEVDPIALAELKLNGSCTFELPERYWDRYAPGLYFRRFSTVAVSVPAVVGRFGGLHGRLTIESARYRKDPTLPALGNPDDAQELAESYALPDDDPRLIRQFPRPGDVILLSTGAQDTGLGADEAREDRYRPFENLGVDSSWRLQISQRDNAFDLSTISDVILHIEYTARDGGPLLTNAARAALVQESPWQGFVVSLRRQYAGEWQHLNSGDPATLNFTPLVSGISPSESERKVIGLVVGVLLRFKTQPVVSTTVQLNLYLGPLTDAGIDQLSDFQLSVNPALALDSDGGARFAFDAKEADMEQGDLLFGNLWDAWTASITPIFGEELEDMLVSVSWKLGVRD